MTKHLLADGKIKCGATPWSSYSLPLFSSEDRDQVNCKRCLNTVKRTAPIRLNENYVGKIIMHSYGYDMTINEYALVIKQTDKSITCREVMASVSNDSGMGEGRSVPSKTFTDDKPFIAFPRACTWRGDSDKVYFAGRGATWNFDDGKPSYYNTWD